MRTTLKVLFIINLILTIISIPVGLNTYFTDVKEIAEHTKHLMNGAEDDPIVHQEVTFTAKSLLDDLDRRMLIISLSQLCWSIIILLTCSVGYYMFPPKPKSLTT